MAGIENVAQGPISEINRLKATEVGDMVCERISEFRSFRKGTNEEIFGEMCFCILTANFNAERAITIQDDIQGGFISLSENALSKKLKSLGHRYPNVRASYIVAARGHKKDLKRILGSLGGDELRQWFVKNIKGLGFKESSHFLRNIGFEDYALIDFHIVDLLVSHGLCDAPKTMTKKRYLEIEGVLRGLGELLDLNLAKLDLYLWYMETDKILK